MNYELIKKLKDARFPFKGETNGCTYHEVNGTTMDIAICLCDAPTLSELIDEMPARVKYIEGLCNDAQFCLAKTVGSSGVFYIALLEGQWDDEEIGNKYRFVTKTPEEAVALLWLELNEKHEK